MVIRMASLLVIVQAVQAAISFTAIAGGTTSGIDEPRQVVVRTADEWRAVWKEHNGRTPAPPVDCSASTVVGLFLGSRRPAGFEVEITALKKEGDALVVEYVERTPGPGSFVAQIITSPFHLASVARNEGEGQFRKVGDPPS